MTIKDTIDKINIMLFSINDLSIISFGFDENNIKKILINEILLVYVK